MTVAVLVGMSMDLWQRRVVALADEWWPGPRLHYLDLDGEPNTSPPGPSMVLVFRPHVPEQGWPGGPRIDLSWDPR